MNRLSRDSIVSRGMQEEERARTHGQRFWMYPIKIKSGKRKSIFTTMQAYNIKHLRAIVIMNHARTNEKISITMLSRIMRSKFSSPREDY